MKIVRVNTLKPGDVLGKSIFNERAELMLAAGHTLTVDMIRLVEKHGVHHIYLMDEITRGIVPEEVIDEAVRQSVNADLAEGFEDIRRQAAFKAFSPEEIRRKLDRSAPLIDMSSIRRQVILLVEEIVDNHISMFTSLPLKSDTGRDCEHAIDTTLLSILIGQMFKYDYRELKELGTASLVHDIGKLLFPGLSGKSHSKLGKDERMLLFEHPTFSMLMFRSGDPDSFPEQAAVLQHHENQDGSGYPQGLQGNQARPVRRQRHDSSLIFRHAEIISTANVYDNYISGAFSGVRHTPAEAITRLVNEHAEQLNQYCISALSKVVQCYPAGSTVRILKTTLNSFLDYTGVVAKANPENQSAPVILLTHNDRGGKIKPRLVDFSKESVMEIELTT